MTEQNLATSREEYLWRRNTLMYCSVQRSPSSCERVERDDYDRTGACDIADYLRVIVGPYLAKKAGFGEEIACGAVTDQRILQSWRHPELGIDGR